MYHRITWPRAVTLALPIAFGAWTARAADLVETAKQVGGFEGFLRLLEAAGMAEVLEGEGPLTVFAPTDEAFERLPPGLLERLLADPSGSPLEVVAGTHVVAGAAIKSRDLLGRAVEVRTLGGGALAVDGTMGIIALVPIEPALTEVERRGRPVAPTGVMTVSMTVVEAPRNSAREADHRATAELTGVATVAAPDIEADNGVIHGIDRVLLPPAALWSF